MKTSALLLSLILLVGCVTNDPLARFYQPYTGAQQSWPVAPGGFTTEVEGMIFYHGTPDVPYTIIGRLVQPNLRPATIAVSARFHGANAVMLAEQQINGLKTDPGVMLFGNGFAVQTEGQTKAVSRTLSQAYLIKTNSTPANP
jgi:hypothetical protein